MARVPAVAAAFGRIVLAVDESTGNPWSLVVTVLVVLGALSLGWSLFLQLRVRLRRAASERVPDTAQWPEEDAEGPPGR